MRKKIFETEARQCQKQLKIKSSCHRISLDHYSLAFNNIIASTVCLVIMFSISRRVCVWNYSRLSALVVSP